MISGAIQDWQITASSTYPLEWDKGCHERYGRLYQPNGLGWCAKYKSSSEWLQVDLGVAAKVRRDGTFVTVKLATVTRELLVVAVAVTVMMTTE